MTTLNNLTKFTKKNKIIIFLVLLAILVFSLRIGKVSTMSCDPDLAGIAYTGMGINDGKVPYLDISGGKPPLSFFTVGLLFNLFGTEFSVIYAASIFLMIISAILIFFTVKEIINFETGCLASILYAFFSATESVRGACPNYTTWMILPLIASLYFLVMGEKYNKKTFYFLSGIFIAASIFTKQSALLNLAGILGYFIIAFVINKKRDLKKLLHKLFYFFFGLLIFLLPFLIYFGSAGALSELAPNVIPSASYTLSSEAFSKISNQTSSTPFEPVLEIMRKTKMNVMPNILLYILAASFLIFPLGKRFRKSILSSNLILLALIWTVFSYLGVCAGGRFYHHYFVQIIPGLTIMAALTIYYLYKTIKKFKTGIIAALIVLTLVQPTIGIFGPESGLHRNHTITTQLYETGEYVKSITGPEDKIYVWGYAPEIYVYSERFSPTKHYKFWIVVKSLDTQNIVKENVNDSIFLDHLKNDKPSVFISTNKRMDPGLDEYERLNNFIKENYIFDRNISNIEVYTLK